MKNLITLCIIVIILGMMLIGLMKRDQETENMKKRIDALEKKCDRITFHSHEDSQNQE